MDRHGGPFTVLAVVTLVGVHRALVPPLLLVLAVLAASACTVEDGPTGQSAPTTASTVASTVVDETATTSTTEAADPSTAVILIGPARYELSALCAAGGAGEVEVSLSGTDVNGMAVIGYVRAFLGEPYVSLQVGEGDDAVLFEPRLEGVLEFDLTDRVVTFPEVEFVTGLDLASGDFVPAGIGSVAIDCRSYARELPPVPFE